jgi:pyruvate/2-oxoglutarate dehydrogenase complex dihydrolipoamide acyltransferase (E2) component
LRSGIALVAVLLFAVGCGVERGEGTAMNAGAAAAGTEEPAPETFALGTAVSASGAVPQDASAETFIRGGEVYLSVDVRSASTDQTIEVKWIDPHGRVLRSDERHVPQEAQYVPFSSGATSRWPRGPHRAVILIDGRTVSEKTFAVL